MSKPQTTPMMVQYRRAKSEIDPGTILFFRLGDFYEMFFEDAVVASDILGIALTKRQGTPMCGIPYHAADLYLAKLLRAGKKVALCDQMEDPAQAKGIVKREVTGIVTPGTVLTDSVLDAARPNYLAGLHRLGKTYGLAMLDLSTGDFWMEESADPDALLDDLARYAPPRSSSPKPSTPTNAFSPPSRPPAPSPSPPARTGSSTPPPPKTASAATSA
jgi:DNA mismatch repair protein MutS